MSRHCAIGSSPMAQSHITQPEPWPLQNPPCWLTSHVHPPPLVDDDAALPTAASALLALLCTVAFAGPPLPPPAPPAPPLPALACDDATVPATVPPPLPALAFAGPPWPPAPSPPPAVAVEASASALDATPAPFSRGGDVGAVASRNGSPPTHAVRMAARASRAMGMCFFMAPTYARHRATLPAFFCRSLPVLDGMGLDLYPGRKAGTPAPMPTAPRSRDGHVNNVSGRKRYGVEGHTTWDSPIRASSRRRT